MVSNVKYYPLTGAQKSISIIEQFYPGTSYANLAVTVRFKGEPDFGLLNKTINSLIETNIALRTRIVFKDKEIVQYFCEYKPEVFDVLDFSHQSNREEHVHWARKTSRKPFEFYDGNLYYFSILRLSNGEFGVFIKLHHVIADFWSLILLVNQLAENYRRLKEGGTLIDDRGSYIDHILEEEKYRSSARFSRDKAYWDKKIEKMVHTTLFPKRENNSLKAVRKKYSLTGKSSSQIKELCSSLNISPFILFAGAASLYHWKRSGRETIVIGTTLLNRLSLKDKNTFGAYFNNLPFVIEIDPSLSFKEYLKYLNSEWMELLRHSSFPYEDVLKNYRRFHNVKNELFDFTLAFLNAALVNDNIPFTIEAHFNDQEVNILRLNIDDMNNEGIFHLGYDYADEVLTEEDIISIHEGMLNLLPQNLSDLDVNISELSLLSEEEEQLILYGFNNKIEEVQGRNIIELFREQVADNPQKVALVFEEEQLTYQEVNEKSNQLAKFLIKKGVKREEIIGFCVERSPDLIIGILGILKASAAYLPIDPGYPADRIAYMLTDSNSRFCVTNSDQSSTKVKDGIEIIDLRDSRIWMEGKEDQHCFAAPSDLAVVLYTSGSTGFPKGVMTEHRALSSYVYAISRKFDLKNKTILSLTTLSFDIFFTENILPLLVGMKVVIANDAEQADPRLQTDLLGKHKIDVFQTTPSRMTALLNNSTKYIDRFSIIIIGGEIFPKSLLLRLKAVTSADIFNAYGPTEATIISTMKLLEDDNDITIGKPLDNTCIYILDEFLKPVPIGTVGEIYIGGNGLARGYLNKPELTAERFIPNPFIPDKRMYKTGDLGKWQMNREILYIGRNDNQVKLRGYRIELGEIENVILKNEYIKQAAVTCNNNIGGRPYLCAYLTGNKQLSVPQLRRYLSQYLPEFMIPHKFIWLEVMPTTPNGKIDRNSLQEPNTVGETVGDYAENNNYVAPRDEIEQSLATIWSLVLQVPKVGINDDFFVLGGDSLAILEVLSWIFPKGWKISAQEFYEYSTIRKLSSIIRERSTKHIKKDALQKPSPILEKIPLCSNGPTLNQGSVLLTGATGFLGMHILFELLNNSTNKVFCLVRGNDYKKRFWDLFEFYFPNYASTEADLHDQIYLICGDVSEDRFGLPEQEFRWLANNVYSVIHSAALVKHFGDYSEFDRINVKGTKEVINFCLKHHKHLSYISTMSVSGNYISNLKHTLTFSENDLYIGQDYKCNVYVRSKFESEALIVGAVNNGLKANIFRVGALTGRYSDGHFQYNIEENAYYQRLRSVFFLGYYPENSLGDHLEFTPVDMCAKAIITILNAPREQLVFHLFNQNKLDIGNFFRIIENFGINIRIVSSKEFLKIINSIVHSQEGKEITKGIVNNLLMNGSLNYSTSVVTESFLTINFLESLGFKWPDITSDYLKRIISYMRKVKFLYEKLGINI